MTQNILLALFIFQCGYEGFIRQNVERAKTPSGNKKKPSCLQLYIIIGLDSIALDSELEQNRRAVNAK